MNINWRAVFGLQVLVEFSDGTFGIRKRILPFLPIMMYRDFKADMWWTKSSHHFRDCQHQDRGYVERYLLKGYKRRVTEKVLPTNLKMLHAEHLLHPPQQQTDNHVASIASAAMQAIHTQQQKQYQTFVPYGNLAAYADQIARMDKIAKAKP